MIKDILENFIGEIQNEKNQEMLHIAFEPFIHKIKIYFFTVLFLLFGILLALLMILFNITKI